MSRSLACFALALLSAALALPACATLGAGRTYRSDVAADCRYYDDSHLAWSAVATAGSSVAGGTSILLTVVDGVVVDEDDARDWTLGLAVTAAVGAVLSAVAVPLASEYAARFAERCRDSAEPEPEPEPPRDAGPDPEFAPVPGMSGTGADGLTPEEMAPAEVVP